MNNTRKIRDPEEWKRTSEKGLANRKHENILAANRLLGKQREGKEMAAVTKDGAPSRGSKSPLHWRSKWWSFGRHDGTVIEGTNLSELVRRNARLFAQEDVLWEKSKCRASRGLRQLQEGCVNGPRSWKGWSVR